MRGQAAKLKDTRTSANGYHYTKTTTGWRLTHHIVAEEKYNRHIDKDVTVRFVDRDKTNLRPSNIVIQPKKNSDDRKKVLKRRIAELQAELDALNSQSSDN